MEVKMEVGGEEGPGVDVAAMGLDMGDDLGKRSHMHLPPNVKKEAKKLLEKNGGYMPRDEDISMLTDASGMVLVDGTIREIKKKMSAARGGSRKTPPHAANIERRPRDTYTKDTHMWYT